MAQKGYLTNLASEFYVISTLCRLGLDASLTLGNRKRVDITVIIDEGKALTIDVKAVAGKVDWLLGNNPLQAAKNHFVVLLSYEGKFSDTSCLPKVWIVPSEKLASFVKVAGNNTTRFLSRKTFREDGKEYENAWGLLK